MEESTEEVTQETEETETEDEEVPAITQKAEKTVPYERFKEVNTELARLKKTPVVKTTLDVEDFLDISASLEGLDQREKEFLAEQHKLTGLPLVEIRKGENFSLWQQGYQAKAEKERALKPSGTQPESARKKTAVERITSAKTLDDQEKLLKEYGLLKEHRPRADRQTIG